MLLSEIDTRFDFTSDTPGYWDGFWERRGGLGAPGADPDALSPTLREYHRLLWSRELPNGQTMSLEHGAGYLRWGERSFGSDSITATFRYSRYRQMLDEVASTMADYRSFVEGYLRKLYTIGGTIIFPRHRGSMNQARGTSVVVSDRWDLTLECIRRHYSGEPSPLSHVTQADSWFYDLFVDFEGYVRFFFLEDCIREDGNVVIWQGDGSMELENPWPTSVDEYLDWVDAQIEFVERRNLRIADYARRAQ